MRNTLSEQREWITEMYEMDKSEAELKPIVMKLTREQLLEKIDQCKGDYFLIYGYARQLEELDKNQKENKAEKCRDCGCPPETCACDIVDANIDEFYIP